MAAAARPACKAARLETAAGDGRRCVTGRGTRRSRGGRARRRRSRESLGAARRVEPTTLGVAEHDQAAVRGGRRRDGDDVRQRPLAAGDG